MFLRLIDTNNDTTEIAENEIEVMEAVTLALNSSDNEPVSDDVFDLLIEQGYWPQDIMRMRQGEACLLLAA